jgi:hypothetical protein
MRIDPLQQFAKLRLQLTEEKRRLEARLTEINQVLGTETSSASATVAPAKPASSPAITTGKGRGRGGNTLSIRDVITLAITQRGPLSRKELGKAVVELGYKSKAKNVLGSIGNLLYGKNSPFKSKHGKFYLADGTQSTATVRSNGNDSDVATANKKRRKMSPEGRARIAAAQRARRERERAGK